jgi:hypothetical protein
LRIKAILIASWYKEPTAKRQSQLQNASFAIPTELVGCIGRAVPHLTADVSPSFARGSKGLSKL